MAAPPECSRRGASLRATLLILTVVLAAVVIAAGNSVDVSSRIELLTSSSSSPASPTPARPLLSVSAGLRLATAYFPVKQKRSRGGDTSTSPSVERELDAARARIRRAARRRRNDLGHGDGNVSTADSWFDAGVESALLDSVYRNPAAFHRSYREMERRFKVYVYEAVEPPILHSGPCKDIYSIEGRFIEQLELMSPAPSLQGGRSGGGAAAGGFRTPDPARAHAFFLPFSVAQMVRYAYRPGTYDKTPLLTLVADYVRVVASWHPFWNRSAGYALPFADVLRWGAFSVAVPVAGIPRLKEVLEWIPAPGVERMRQGVRFVKRHFTLHQPPEMLDMFHMILHSVCLRRLNFRLDH